MFKFKFQAIPCTITEGGNVQINISDMIGAKALVVETKDLATAQSYGEGMAAEFGQPCIIAVDCLSKPKPRGFGPWERENFGTARAFNA